MSQLLNKGYKFCSGLSAAAGTTYYPDPDAAATATTYGLSTVSTNSVFDVGGRDAIIHGVFIDFQGASFPLMAIKEHNGSDSLLGFVAPQFTGGYFAFGKEGIRISGGFEVELLASAGTFNWTVIYEIV